MKALLVMAVAACGPGGRDPETGRSPDATVDPQADAVASADGKAYVFAHSKDALYRIDPETLSVTEVGPFTWSDGDDVMTDIAIDYSGAMLGISYTSVYRVDVTTAAATRLSTGLTGQFNGLSFVPRAMLGEAGAGDVLVATRADDGVVFRIDPASGNATSIGDMGMYASSGDLVSVTGFGTMLTASNGLDNDRLVELAMQSFYASPVGGDTTGFTKLYGVAYWSGRVFGFTGSGQLVLIDPATGVGTLVQSGGPKWWGAAVTTAAPIL